MTLKSGSYLSCHFPGLHKRVIQHHLSICVRTPENNRQATVSSLTDDYVRWRALSWQVTSKRRGSNMTRITRITHPEGKLWQTANEPCYISIYTVYHSILHETVRCPCSRCKKPTERAWVSARAHFNMLVVRIFHAPQSEREKPFHLLFNFSGSAISPCRSSEHCANPKKNFILNSSPYHRWRSLEIINDQYPVYAAPSDRGEKHVATLNNLKDG